MLFLHLDFLQALTPSINVQEAVTLSCFFAIEAQAQFRAAEHQVGLVLRQGSEEGRTVYWFHQGTWSLKPWLSSWFQQGLPEWPPGCPSVSQSHVSKEIGINNIGKRRHAGEEAQSQENSLRGQAKNISLKLLKELYSCCLFLMNISLPIFDSQFHNFNIMKMKDAGRNKGMCLEQNRTSQHHCAG